MALTAVTISVISAKILTQPCGFCPGIHNPAILRVSSQPNTTSRIPQLHPFFSSPFSYTSQLHHHHHLALRLDRISLNCSASPPSPSPSHKLSGGRSTIPHPSNFPRNTPPISYVIPVSLRNTINPILHGWYLLHTLPPSFVASSSSHLLSQANHLTPKTIGRKTTSPPPFQRIMINRPVTPQMPAYTNTLISNEKRRDGQTRARAAGQKKRHTPPLPNHLLQPFFSSSHRPPRRGRKAENPT
ncbi:hypothetical protein GGI42DRAFT_243814 [Trichoderma sp. SZMC 28013]